jgi:hypothetical protein
MYGFGEDMLLLVSLVGAIRVGQRARHDRRRPVLRRLGAFRDFWAGG